MPRRKCLWFLFLICAVLLLGAQDASACSCAEKSTVLEAYESSDIVALVKVVELEKSEAHPGRTQGVYGVSGATAIVDKVFKGNLKAGDELFFVQGGGADCVWTFSEESIGQQFLVYLNARAKNQKKWYVGTCGRSNTVEAGADDLLYLNKLDKVRGKTRISGRLSFFYQGPEFDVGNYSLRLVGANKTYQLKTDSDGVYEIYDLPAGKYFLEFEVPFGWKVNSYLLRDATDSKGERGEAFVRRVPIELEDKRHAGFDIYFEIENAIGGHVYDMSGKPMKEVCVKAVAPQTGKQLGFNLSCTDIEGRFSIKDLLPGSYILSVNEEGKISSTEPFRKFYYPNVTEPEKATVFTVGPGDFREDVNIHITRMEETITVEGVFIYSDGKPVVEENVNFESEKTDVNINSNARTRTDKNGRFSIKILKGWKGQLSGSMYTYLGEFKNCQKLDEIIKKMEGRSLDIKTPFIKLQADRDVYDVELRFPFPGCEKAK